MPLFYYSGSHKLYDIQSVFHSAHLTPGTACPSTSKIADFLGDSRIFPYIIFEICLTDTTLKRLPCYGAAKRPILTYLSCLSNIITLK